MKPAMTPRRQAQALAIAIALSALPGLAQSVSYTRPAHGGGTQTTTLWVNGNGSLGYSTLYRSAPSNGGRGTALHPNTFRNSYQPRPNGLDPSKRLRDPYGR